MMVASPGKDPADKDPAEVCFRSPPDLEKDPAGKESAEVCFGSPSDLERDKGLVRKDHSKED